MESGIVFSIGLIFIGAAFFATIALLTRQSLLVAYILVGAAFGPWSLKLVEDSRVIGEIGDVGIVFLLFLLGLHLSPKNLLQMLKKVSLVALISAAFFAMIGYAVAYSYGFSQIEALVVAAAMMFSSTIIGLKLLPTNVLHHQHVGDLMIGVLLMQDLIAIAVLIALHAAGGDGISVKQVSMIVASVPLLLIAAFVGEKFVLLPLIKRFDRIREYMFLLSVAWCLSMSELANFMHVSTEVGAFIAGVALASNPISLYIAECLKPLRDFFLVVFFFSVGASFNFNYLPIVLYPALTLAFSLQLLKPIVFAGLFKFVGEESSTSWELGSRLGQNSEFALLVTYIALNNAIISNSAAYLIQAATLITFFISSYWVVGRYPTPMALNTDLQKE